MRWWEKWQKKGSRKGKHWPQILRGASSSSRMGWLRKISLDLMQRPRTSASDIWTIFPGRHPRTREERKDKMLSLLSTVIIITVNANAVVAEPATAKNTTELSNANMWGPPHSKSWVGPSSAALCRLLLTSFIERILTISKILLNLIIHLRTLDTNDGVNCTECNLNYWSFLTKQTNKNVKILFFPIAHCHRVQDFIIKDVVKRPPDYSDQIVTQISTWHWSCRSAQRTLSHLMLTLCDQLRHLPHLSLPPSSSSWLPLCDYKISERSC